VGRHDNKNTQKRRHHGRRERRRGERKRVEKERYERCTIPWHDLPSNETLMSEVVRGARSRGPFLADFEAQGSHTGMALTSVAAPSRPAPLVIRLFQADHNHTYNCKVQ
jgi:hypothetical protein